MGHAASRWSQLAMMALIALILGPGASGAAADTAGTTVSTLDTTGFWRIHHELAAPLLVLDKGLEPVDFRWHHGDRVLNTFRWAGSETTPAGDGWTGEGFDDTSWLRGPARMVCLSPLVARLSMRGRFEVTDPSKVRNLRLSVSYRGGVIVYLNGKEAARKDIAGKDADGRPLARGYPADAFTPTGGWSGAWTRGGATESEHDIALRRRSAEIELPARLLRKGVNVLALEIVRAPYHKIVEEMKGKRGSRYCPYCLAFNTCQIELVRLHAAAGDGIVPNVVRPKGFQVWNSNTLCADYDLDFGDPGPVLPVKLVGARNGSYSGKVAVGSDAPIRGLRVTAGDLEAAGATIPASAVRIRYGIPWGREAGVNGQRSIYRGSVPQFDCYPRRPTMLGALADRPLDEFPVRVVGPGGADLKFPGQVEPVPGAVVPVWITVDVPRNTPAGLFKGQVMIAAEGQAAHAVPVQVEVIDYTLPDPQDYRTVLDLIQSPDTLVLEYGVKPWSDEHFGLIARSMKLMREAGVQVLYVPLIGQTNHGNEETMVRWIKTGQTSFDFDFSVMDRYLDLAAEHMGRPRVVCFIAWDIYLGGSGGGYKDTWGHNQRSVELRKEYIGKGPAVTMLDRATGEARTEFLPPYSDPAARAAWKRLFGELRTRMAKRQWEKAMMVGLLSDDWPTEAEREFYVDVTGNLPWVSHSHVPVTRDMGGTEEGGIVVTGATSQGSAKVNRVGFRVGYHSAVFNDEFPMDGPPLGSLGGWRRPDLGTYQPRYESSQPASRWRQLMEVNIAGRQRGVSRGGADFWSAVRDRRGQRIGNVADRYPQSAWRNLDIPWCMFAPGPTGPASTHQFEALREGIQECQARILLEEALGDKAARARLGDDLARRCEQVLAERTDLMIKALGHLQVNNDWGHLTGPEPICRQDGVNGHRWFAGSGWQDRSRQLYNLAAEVSKRMGR